MTKRKQKEPVDIHQKVTDKIIADIEAGTCKWIKPWDNHGKVFEPMMPYNVIRRENYQGINIPVLWAEGYDSCAWGSYDQWASVGGQVRKDEKGTEIILYKVATGKVKGEIPEGGDDKYKFRMMKTWKIFNREQVDIDDAKIPKLPVVATPVHPKSAVMDLCKEVGATVQHGGDRAYYNPSLDFIGMPKPTQFKSEMFYSVVLAHELTHWTGHKTRLERDLSGMFGMEKYAQEELVAELGSAFLCARIGLEWDSAHASAYIKNWLTALKDDKKFIFRAASQAQKAVDFILKVEKEVETSEAA